MKPFSPWKALILFTLFFGIFVLSQLFLYNQPTRVQAQDIDDVLDIFSGDFGFAGKDEVKQQNVQDANEQNREDIQIRLEEKRKKSIEAQNQSNSQPPLATTANVQVRFTTIAPDDVIDVFLGVIPGFMGTLSASNPQQTIVFPAVPLGPQTLTVTCQAGSGIDCQLTQDMFVNVTCPTPHGVTIASGNTLSKVCNVP